MTHFTPSTHEQNVQAIEFLASKLSETYYDHMTGLGYKNCKAENIRSYGESSTTATLKFELDNKVSKEFIIEIDKPFSSLNIARIKISNMRSDGSTGFELGSTYFAYQPGIDSNGETFYKNQLFKIFDHFVNLISSNKVSIENYSEFFRPLYRYGYNVGDMLNEFNKFIFIKFGLDKWTIKDLGMGYLGVRANPDFENDIGRPCRFVVDTNNTHNANYRTLVSFIEKFSKVDPNDKYYVGPICEAFISLNQEAHFYPEYIDAKHLTLRANGLNVEKEKASLFKCTAHLVESNTYIDNPSIYTLMNFEHGTEIEFTVEGASKYTSDFNSDGKIFSFVQNLKQWLF